MMRLVHDVGRLHVQQMTCVGNHRQCCVGQMVHQVLRVGEGCLVVERTHHHQGGRGDAGQQWARVVGDEAVDAASQRLGGDARHGGPLAGEAHRA